MICKTELRDGKDWCLTHGQPFKVCQPGRAPPRHRRGAVPCRDPVPLTGSQQLGHGRAYIPHEDEDETGVSLNTRVTP